jgi:N-acetylglutamate synthase-like GNAT family acetyltransferase/DNA-binding MarR family transcriptional regulator
VYSILAESRSPVTVMNIAKQIAFSHITVKNILRELEAERLVIIRPNHEDKRSKTVKLSAEGRKLLSKLKPLWMDFAAALQNIFESGHPDFLNILNRIDHEINSLPVHERVKDLPGLIRIVDYKPSLKEYFNKLAGKWLPGLPDYKIAKEDKFALDNPDQAYILHGGFVFFAVYEGEVVGTVALKRLDEDSFEFASLFIDPEYRNLGIATKLIEKCISRCRENRAEELWVQSDRSMPEAHELYSKLGFKEREAPIQMQVYKRTEKIMCMSL